METDDNLIMKLEEAGIGDEEIQFITSRLKEHTENKKQDGGILDLTIKQQIIEEKDWKKRAKLAALLISSKMDV